MICTIKGDKVLQRLKKKSFTNYFDRKTNPTFLLLTFFVIFSIDCLACLHAQPYKTNLNDISWARYVAPSPLGMSDDTFNDYEGDKSDDEREEGIIEEEPVQGNTENNVPSAYEELDNILEDENDLEETKSNAALKHESDRKPYRQPRQPPTRPQPSALSREKVPQQPSGKLNPSVMTSTQLKGFLSQFYLIRTPYGYILGRHNPAISTTSISRRSMQPPKPRMKDNNYGRSMMSPLYGAYVPPFGIRRPIAKKNFRK